MHTRTSREPTGFRDIKRPSACCESCCTARKVVRDQDERRGWSLEHTPFVFICILYREPFFIEPYRAGASIKSRPSSPRSTPTLFIFIVSKQDSRVAVFRYNSSGRPSDQIRSFFLFYELNTLSTCFYNPDLLVSCSPLCKCFILVQFAVKCIPGALSVRRKYTPVL